LALELFEPPLVVSPGKNIPHGQMGEMLVEQLENMSSASVFCGCIISFVMFLIEILFVFTLRTVPW
jgi:hypothetical protein